VTAEQALGVLDALAGRGVEAWVDGGWGVDALVGRQSRPHSDLDLVIPGEHFVAACAALRADGFAFEREELPASVVFRHEDGREVDLHPAERTADGGGDQYRPDGVGRWHYGPPVRGRIGGRWVTCLSLETQLRGHVGYEPDEDDFADMRLLRDELGCELPAPFDRA
jgi:lincosamide nucleotidyltransferase A/C/D/E